MLRRIIIDTDPGLDDAVAILLALAAADQLEILGIATVAGNLPLELTERLRLLLVPRDYLSAYMKLGVRSRKDAAALILDPDDGLGTAALAISGA